MYISMYMCMATYMYIYTYMAITHTCTYIRVRGVPEPIIFSLDALCPGSAKNKHP